MREACGNKGSRESNPAPIKFQALLGGLSCVGCFKLDIGTNGSLKCPMTVAWTKVACGISPC